MPGSIYWVTNKRQSPSLVSMSGSEMSDEGFEKISYHQESHGASRQSTTEDKDSDNNIKSNNTNNNDTLGPAPFLPSFENPLEKGEREKQARIGKILYDAFDELGKRPGAGGLADSQWAVDESDDDEGYVEKVARIRREAAINNRNKAAAAAATAAAQASRRPAAPLEKPVFSSPSSTVKKVAQVATRVADEKRKEMANVDDTEGFMAAVHKRLGHRSIQAASPATPTSATAQTPAADRPVETKNVDKGVQASITTTVPAVAPRELTNVAPTPRGPVAEKPVRPAQVIPKDVPMEASKVVAEKPVLPAQAPTAKKETPFEVRGDGDAPAKPVPTTLAPAPAGEDREHMVRFSTWGAPPPRDTPAARIRRVILRGLPSFINTPAKVQALIFGGQIESFAISASGTAAQVMFCDADAAKSFYDSHPNGIPVNYNGRTGVVFVDFGQDVDVVSSQLRTYLNLGATRVVRAIGADTDFSMAELIDMATKKNLKLEKIFDMYDPGDKCRTVTFRFCSIDDAARFRGILLRDDAWEQCNIQYAPDPCENAKGIHWD